MMMKFKEIKPGMVIHCPKEEDARALLEHLGYSYEMFPWRRFKEESCYEVLGSEYLHPYLRERDFFGGSKITEFSDLIEAEPRFEVGDRVRIKKISEIENLIPTREQIYAGEEFTITAITKCGDGVLYEGHENPYKWTEEILEIVDDSSTHPLDSSAEMSAVEVLEWLRENYNHVTLHCNGFDETSGFGQIIKNHTPKEIVQRITAYEAAKKEPKSVEVEHIWVVKVHEQFGTVVHEEELPQTNDVEFLYEEITKSFKGETGKKYYTTIEQRCRVKGAQDE